MSATAEKSGSDSLRAAKAAIGHERRGERGSIFLNTPYESLVAS